MTTIVGYARVSTFEQFLDLQRDALDAAGCKRIFTDTAGGGRSDRPGLQQALDYVRDGDVLVVWRLDRPGRSLKYLIEVITALNERGISFVSLTEQIDTTTSGGKLIFHVFGALAEFERDVIRERTQAGLAAARARGRMGGRPKKLDGAAKVAMAQPLRRQDPLRRGHLQDARHLPHHPLPLRPDRAASEANNRIGGGNAQATEDAGFGSSHAHLRGILCSEGALLPASTSRARSLRCP